MTESQHEMHVQSWNAFSFLAEHPTTTNTQKTISNLHDDIYCWAKTCAGKGCEVELNQNELGRKLNGLDQIIQTCAENC